MSPDGLVCTFALRAGVRFHDAEPLDAASAKLTPGRARGPASTSPQQQFLPAIDAVEAPAPPPSWCG